MLIFLGIVYCFTHISQLTKHHRASNFQNHRARRLKIRSSSGSPMAPVAPGAPSPGAEKAGGPFQNGHGPWRMDPGLSFEMVSHLKIMLVSSILTLDFVTLIVGQWNNEIHGI